MSVGALALQWPHTPVSLVAPVHMARRHHSTRMVHLLHRCAAAVAAMRFGQSHSPAGTALGSRPSLMYMVALNLMPGTPVGRN